MFKIVNMNIVINSSKSFMLAAWPRGLKRHFYSDRVIMITWSRFKSKPRRTHCCIFGW